ncbi:hypothetical protein FI667_g1906, partial [Globisporangium splendens]
MPKKFSPSDHWTKGLTGEQTTTKPGARFHLRELFFRQEEFSQDELEFIVQYLVHETTIQEQQWWVALAQHGRLEIVSRLKLHHVAKGEEQIIWFSRNETSKGCILLYGNAEAKPIDPGAAVVLSFSEGSVIGNLNLPHSVQSQQISTNEQQPHTLEALASSGSASNWRRVKRERQFCGALQHYNKVPDYLLLTSSDVLETISRAADRVEQDNWIKAFGLERFAGCIRWRVFEPGAFLAREEELLGSMFIVMEGECRASIRSDDTSRQPPKKTLAELSQEDLAKECGDLRDPFIVASMEKLRKIAYDTLAFILDRVKAEAKYAQSDQRLKVERTREWLREKKERKQLAFCKSVSVLKFDARFVLFAIILVVSQPFSGTTMRLQSPSGGPSIGTASWTNPSAASSEKGVQQMALPAVVLRHAATIAESKTKSISPYLMSNEKLQQEQEEGREVGDAQSPSHVMTCQQKRVARAFTSLYSPTAGKSLGDAFANCRTAIHGGGGLDADRTEWDAFDGKKSSSNSFEAGGDSLFLFPTMTRQRQLHGK